MKIMNSGRYRTTAKRCQCIVKEDPLDGKGKETWFRYNKCSKKFVKNRAPRMHMMIHTMEKPYVCTMCDQTYTTKYNLNRHLMSIHRENTIHNKSIDWKVKYETYCFD
ncbi:unnamed protein product, partial [Meganyctiphanes norvegica]